MPSAVAARDRFLALLRTSVEAGTLVKLTLGKPCGADASLHNLFVRPVALKTGPHLTFLWRHATRDITKNHPPTEGLALVAALLGTEFLDAHLFTPAESAQLETQPDGGARLRLKAAAPAAPGIGFRDSSGSRAAAHNRTKAYLVPADAPWLRALGVTNERGQPREGMADKFRQIQNFAALLRPLLAEAFPPAPPATTAAAPLRVVDMGSGKGYLTFALASLLGAGAHVTGVESRPALVDLCNQIAGRHGLAASLDFAAGTIAEVALGAIDVLVALHACDTATDDALARGLAAGATLLVVSPCCQKELRPQLAAPPVLADALAHGIFQERQAEFATDALRAQLLEWAGYRTKVFEFVSTEHTAKNLMIAAVRAHGPGDPARAARIRAFATFYGIRRHRLATHLGFDLSAVA